MGKNWDYSRMAHNAKICGGPERYVEAIHQSGIVKGRIQGKKEGKAELLIAECIVAGIGLLGFAGYKTYTMTKDRHERLELEFKEREAEEAKRELIKGIKEEMVKENNELQHNEDEEEKMNKTVTDDNIE